MAHRQTANTCKVGLSCYVPDCPSTGDRGGALTLVKGLLIHYSGVQVSCSPQKINRLEARGSGPSVIGLWLLLPSGLTCGPIDQQHLLGQRRG